MGVWGEIPKRETTAIMGPSGAGKSSLLNILAGRVSSSRGGRGRGRGGGKLNIESDIRLDNHRVDPTNIRVRKRIAFVAQDDSLQTTSTPREAIYFSAKLRLPKSITESELKTLTDEMISELGLVDCADTIVGGALKKGISGGERKRTSIGVELVVKPALVFLDEPTSGLDSFSAVQVCEVLKKVANAGASVLFTIHQPSSEIFDSFDHLILLNKGRVMYHGSVNDVPAYFEERGNPVPSRYNPADWIMNVAQSIPVVQLNEKGFFPDDDRKMGDPIHDDELDGADALGITGITMTGHDSQSSQYRDEKLGDESKVSMQVQTRMLFLREFKGFGRDTAALVVRFGITIFLSLIVGIIFLGVGKTDSRDPINLQSQFGALIMVLMMAMMGTSSAALMAFPEERPVFLREYSTND